MAKKDTINALVRRGLDRDSAEELADNGFLLNDVKSASKEELMEVLSEEKAIEVIEEIQEKEEKLDKNKSERKKGIIKLNENKSKKKEGIVKKYNELSDEKQVGVVIGVILIIIILIVSVYVSIPPSTEEKILDAAEHKVSTLDDKYAEYIPWFPAVHVVEEDSYYNEDEKFAYILLKITYFPDGPQSIDYSTRDNFINAAAVGAFSKTTEEELQKVQISFYFVENFSRDDEIEVYVPGEEDISYP